MENLCKIRDIQRAVAAFEARFEKQYGICLNEGMALCSLHKAGSLTSGELGELLGLTASNISKVLKSVEEKQLAERTLGEKDRRQMYFSLTEGGKKLIAEIDCRPEELPELLRGLFLK